MGSFVKHITKLINKPKLSLFFFFFLFFFYLFFFLLNSIIHKSIHEQYFYLSLTCLLNKPKIEAQVWIVYG